ncbi:MAG: hypothetical protein CM1200mP18_11040 [Gammaproteobacteria bacterium]|nr:MAG: hypothetical protein CM1200mP18_11040 [Gammaproteobacteria bacterium]
MTGRSSFTDRLSLLWAAAGPDTPIPFETTRDVPQVGGLGLAAPYPRTCESNLYHSAQKTTVASALFTISASPLITAVLARIFLKEHISRPTMVAIVVAMIGISIMVSDGILSGSIFGNLLALLCAFFFSTFVIFLRVGKDRNMLPASVMGAIIGGLIGLVGCEFDFKVSLHDLSLLFLWGGSS